MDLLLLDELCAFITSITRDYLVDTPGKGLVAPQVVEGFLPPKREDGRDEDDEPMILVRMVDGQDEWVAAEMQGRGLANVAIVVRTASEDVTVGPRNTLNLMNLIRRKIYASPILAGRYRAVWPVKWKAPEGNSYPLWQGEMTIPWIIPMPQEVWEVHEFAGEKDPGS